ncbi:hypothetical protein [Pseudomonas sp. PDM20]|uniref:hypothetical protein n=1 Tax=Pseudomonas sp. PDM20 TaxID=2769254 RepID=UPI0017809C22|nr:hypothetical protein [Pseudomonas sp. PDM20]MBD9686609.1 hypothetical protein [Pseudomonas sp. PDM20]
MPSRPSSRPLWRWLPSLAALVLSGCASDEFTFEADLPGDFSLVGNARYSPPEGSHCNSPAKDDLTQRLFATPGHGERPYRVSYQVPLRLSSDGCRRELRHILIEMDGESATHPLDAVQPDISFANLAVRSQLSAGSAGMPKKGARIFDGRCRWLLPDSPDGERQLQCRASDIDGNWLAGRPGGELLRDELPGRIVRLAIGVAPDIAASAEPRGTQALTAGSSN